MASLRQRIERLERASGGGKTEAVRGMIERANELHQMLLADEDAPTRDLPQTGCPRYTYVADELLALL